MPAGLAIASTAIGLGISLYQGIKGISDRKKIKEAAENYDRQDIINPYLSIDKYPTQAIQLQKEANERELATNVAIASKAGRGLTLMPQASAVYGRRSKELSAEIESYQLKRDQLIAKGEWDKQAMLERREEGDISGMASQYAAASQNINSAVVSAGSSLAMGLEAYAANPLTFGNKNKPSGTGGLSLSSVGVNTPPQIQTSYDDVPLNPYAETSLYGDWGSTAKGI